MNKNLSKFAAAALIYAAFAVYLYLPCLNHFNRLHYLLVINVCLASLGCFLLSQRWVSEFWASFFAGAMYGFGPFMLVLGSFHPAAGLLAATLPWLFCVPAFVPKTKWRWLEIPLCVLPFLAIVFFFRLAAGYGFFPVPIQAKLHLPDIAGLFATLVMVSKDLTLVGFYHIPIVPLLIGFSMLLAARRFGIIIIFATGLILAFCESFFTVSPIIWLAIPVLCCSVLVGAGMQGLVSAGSADRKWILAAVVIMLALSIITLLLATKYATVFAGFGLQYAKLLIQTAKMYILGAITAGIIFFLARAGLRLHWPRLVLLCAAMAIDIFWGARFIVDRIF